MSLPRFTAEAAVYQTRQAYRTVAAACRDIGPYIAIATASDRIADLNAVRGYIDRIDFTTLKQKLTLPPPLGGHAWTIERADAAVGKYKKWLLLQRKYERVVLSPGREVDTVWHFHILDSRAYIRDTARIFGRYLHHYPYFGITAGTAKAKEELSKTRRLFRAEYREDLVPGESREAPPPVAE
jgi:hypothetical protein